MREESQAPLHSAEFDALAQMLGSAGLPLESGHLLDKAFDGQPLSMLRVGRAGGPVIAEMRGGVAFEQLQDGTDAGIRAVASISTPALLISHARSSRVDVAWALDLASELAVLMLSTRPPEATVLHVAVPQVLTGRVPHVVSSARAARALFLAGKMTLSPLRWCGSTFGFGVEQEQWAIEGMRVLAPRLGGTTGLCGCCLGDDAAAYFSNYSERD
jgi:hypothetical protein